MTRFEKYRAKREQINAECELTEKAARLSTRVAKVVADVNKLNPKILDGYQLTPVAIRKVELIESPQNPAIDQLRAHERNIAARELKGFVELYEETVRKVAIARCFSVSKDDDVELKLPPESIPYLKYEEALKEARRLDVKNVTKQLITQQELTRISDYTHMVRMARLTGVGKQADLEQEAAEAMALQEKMALGIDDYREYLSDNVFQRVSVEAHKATSRQKLRKYLAITAAVAMVALLGCLACFIVYLLGVI